jgi:hypothetical protein
MPEAYDTITPFAYRGDKVQLGLARSGWAAFLVSAVWFGSVVACGMTAGMTGWVTGPSAAPLGREASPVSSAASTMRRNGAGQLAGDILDEVTAAAERGIQRIRATHWLAFSFLRHCGLSLW